MTAPYAITRDPPHPVIADEDNSKDGAGGNDRPHAIRRVIEPTPYSGRDPQTIPPRQFLYARHYIRRYVTATIGASGLGKTSLALVEALAMTTGKPLLGVPVRDPVRVWYWNGEDPYEEIERRVAAIMLHYGLTKSDTADRFFFDSGRNMPLRLATVGPRGGAALNNQDIEAFTAAIVAVRADVAIIDPFISCHGLGENDNPDIDHLIKSGFGTVAEKTNAALELAHHVRKAQSGQEARTVDDARGGSAFIGAVRSARMLNRMTKQEAAEMGVSPEQAPLYFRVDLGKANMQPPLKAVWRRLASEPLGNAQQGWPEDVVQVVEAWAQQEGASLAAEQKVDELFLSLLDEFAARGRYVTDTQSRSGAAVSFARQPLASGTTTAAFGRAQERLFARNIIKAEPWERGKRKLVRVSGTPNDA